MIKNDCAHDTTSNRIVIFISCFCLLLSLSCSRKEFYFSAGNETMTVENAIEILRCSTSVKAYSTGDEKQMDAFLLICTKSEAISIFYDLLLNAPTAEGKFWGLLGIRKIDKKFYKKHVQEIDVSLNIVLEIADTISSRDSIKDLLPSVENGSLLEILRWQSSRRFQHNA